MLGNSAALADMDGTAKVDKRDVIDLRLANENASAPTLVIGSQDWEFLRLCQAMRPKGQTWLLEVLKVVGNLSQAGQEDEALELLASLVDHARSLRAGPH